MHSYDVLFQDADLVWFKSPWEASGLRPTQASERERDPTPAPHTSNHHSSPSQVFDDPAIDGYFMDDGARSERFAPLFANSGFYFLRANPMVQHFMQTVMFRWGRRHGRRQAGKGAVAPTHQPLSHLHSYDMIVQYASQQTLVIQALHEHVARNGLRVRILPFTDFAGGQVVSACVESHV